MLFFLALPGPPIDIKVTEVTATSVRLSWTHPSPTDLLYYVVQYKPRHANQAFAEISGVITLYYTVRNLSPYTEYEFNVIAVNTLGRGPSSAPTIITTGETGNVLVIMLFASYPYKGTRALYLYVPTLVGYENDAMAQHRWLIDLFIDYSPSSSTDNGLGRLWYCSKRTRRRRA